MKVSKRQKIDEKTTATKQSRKVSKECIKLCLVLSAVFFALTRNKHETCRQMDRTCQGACRQKPRLNKISCTTEKRSRRKVLGEKKLKEKA